MTFYEIYEMLWQNVPGTVQIPLTINVQSFYFSMNTIQHLPEIVNHILGFLVIPKNWYYHHTLSLVSRALRDSVSWCEYMDSLNLNMNNPHISMVQPLRRSRRIQTPFSYGIMHVIRKSYGRLTRLRLGNGSYGHRILMEDGHMKDLVRLAPKLRNLRIEIPTRFRKNSLNALNSLEHLQFLHLPIDTQMHQLPSFHRVQSLGISGTPKKSLGFLLGNAQKSVKRLSLRGVRSMVHTDMEALSENFESVMCLKLSRCTTWDTVFHENCHRMMDSARKFMRRLKFIHLDKTNVFCSKFFTNPHFLERYCPQVEHLVTNAGMTPRCVCYRMCAIRAHGNISYAKRCEQCVQENCPNLKLVVVI